MIELERVSKRYQMGGETVTARIAGIGETVNKVVKETTP